MEASGGRLTPFKPFADDDGIDLLIFDKITRRAMPLQVKARRNYDHETGRRVQFNVRVKTLSETGGDILLVKLDGLHIEATWLIPAAELRGVALAKGEHLVCVPSAKPTSSDRFTPYRKGTMADVVAAILARGA